MRLKFLAIGLIAFAFLDTPVGSAADGNSAISSSQAPVVMSIDLTLAKPSSGRGYRKPYVAVWIEDGDKFPVRTLALWVQKTGPGPRWIPDLKQWYKADRMRLLVDDADLIDGLSGATRPAAKYKLTWDGLDGQGQPVSPGKYNLCIEVAREHGTYQVQRVPFEHGLAPLKKSIDSNTEWESVQVHYLGLPK